jgi:hypothetical protein
MPRRDQTEDAELFAAEAALDAAWRTHDALFNASPDPEQDDKAAAARGRLLEAGLCFAAVPAVGLPGLACKLRRLAEDVRDGHTLWTLRLAEGAVADSERLARE